MKDREDVLAEGWRYYNAVFVKYYAIHSGQVVPELMVFLKGLWEFVCRGEFHPVPCDGKIA